MLSNRKAWQEKGLTSFLEKAVPVLCQISGYNSECLAVASAAFTVSVVYQW